MILFPLLLTILTAAPAGGETRPAPATITLKREAAVRGAEFTVGDIADVRGRDAAAIAKIRLGYSPMPGAERRLHSEAVELKLSNAGFTRDQFQMIGTTALVRAVTSTIPAKELSSQVLAQLQINAPANCIIEFPAEPADWQVAAPADSTSRVEIRAARPQGDPRGIVKINVTARAGNDSLGSMELPVRFRYEAEVLVSTMTIANGESVEASRFIKKKMDITNITGEVVTDPAKLVGRVLGRPIAKDHVLVAEDLTLAPIYKKGDQARVIVERGVFRVEAIVRVEGDAFIGGRVAVTCLEFNKTVIARVRDDGMLQITGEK